MGANLSFNKRLVMMRDAIAGIAFLHEKGYMHCDIKSLNFLVAEVCIHVHLCAPCQLIAATRAIARVV
jgi:serine/threonine protein kinase